MPSLANTIHSKVSFMEYAPQQADSSFSLPVVSSFFVFTLPSHARCFHQQFIQIYFIPCGELSVSIARSITCFSLDISLVLSFVCVVFCSATRKLVASRYNRKSNKKGQVRIFVPPGDGWSTYMWTVIGHQKPQNMSHTLSISFAVNLYVHQKTGKKFCDC